MNKQPYEVKKHDIHSKENWWHIQLRDGSCIEMVDKPIHQKNNEQGGK